MKDTIAFFGYPNPEIIGKYKNLYPNAKWVDLDVDFNAPKSSLLPENYCCIIKNIFNNAFYLKDSIIAVLAAVGKDKCDAGFFAAEILKNEGLNVEISYFEDVINPCPTPISDSALPLRKKIETITANIVKTPAPVEIDTGFKPQFGFWGVPPNDLSILDLFPDGTRVFGWTRCVEAKTPASLELEMYVERDLPTVFFAQTFCAKNQLAKYLANKYNGLYIDIDGFATNSVRAKIEAFLRLR